MGYMGNIVSPANKLEWVGVFLKKGEGVILSLPEFRDSDLTHFSAWGAISVWGKISHHQELERI